MEKMSVSAIATLVVLVLPIMFSFLSRLSRYGNSGLDSPDSDYSTRMSMYATLLKTLLLELVVLGVITFYYLEVIAKPTTDGTTKIGKNFFCFQRKIKTIKGYHCRIQVEGPI